MNSGLKYLLLALIFQANLAWAAASGEDPKNREDWRSMVNLAREAYRTKDYQKAILFYETAVPVLPKGIDLSEEIAQTQYRLKQYEAAAATYQKKSKTDAPSAARSFHNLGNIAMEEKNYGKAISAYKNALKKDPSNEQTQYNLSEAIRRQKEEDKKNPPPKNDNQKDKKDKEKPQDNKDQPNQDNPSALNDQTVQRELEKLMKKEAQTKRKIASGKGDNNGTKSQKDW
ncbi:MAG: tetratricopeptide repeat protein [Crocinitomicaceae bacterium]